jgi:hypothetical protein
VKIAQVAPLYESVPPKLYGGTERVVSYLTEELVCQGHDVTLFASGDSVTNARLIAPCRSALRLDNVCVDQLVHHVRMLDMVYRRAGMKIKIAAKVDPADRDYHKQVIEPLFADPVVEYLGEIGDGHKSEFLGQAQALLFPIDWPEPFGIVLIEAMACGTPVIAFRRGSVPEVIDDGVTGFVVDDVDAAVKAVERIPTLSRRRCREVFEERFSARRMAEDYVTIYERLLDDEPPLAVQGLGEACGRY